VSAPDAERAAKAMLENAIVFRGIPTCTRVGVSNGMAIFDLSRSKVSSIRLPNRKASAWQEAT